MPTPFVRWRPRALAHRSGRRRHRTALAASCLLAAALIVAPAQPAAAATYNYGEVLQKALWFFEAQQSGRKSPNNRVEWRGDAHTDDGRTVNGLDRDVSGGWYDAGDHWKSTNTMAYAASMLAWGGIQYRDGYRGIGQMDELLEQLKHVNDFFLRCIADPNPGNLDAFGGYEIVVDVGGRPGPEPGVHSVYTAPEVTAGLTVREALRVNTTVRGPDVAGALSAAMAASALVFWRDGDRNYANALLQRAEKLLKYAERYPFDGNSTSGGNPLAIRPNGGTTAVEYRSNDARDEVHFASAFVHRAKKEMDGGYNGVYLGFARGWYNDRIAGNAGDYWGWWKDLLIGSYNHAAGLAWGQAEPADTTTQGWANSTIGLLDAWVKAQGQCATTPGGLRYRTAYNGAFNLKWLVNQAALVQMMADWTTDTNRRQQYRSFVTGQVDYMLGSNPRNASYVVGFGSNYSRRVDHRAAHGGWAGFESITPGHEYYQDLNRHIIYGALLGGPDNSDNFDDGWSRTDRHYHTEPTLDTNGPFTTVRAGLVARNPGQYQPPGNPPAEARNDSLDWKTTDREFFVRARREWSSDRAIRVEAELHNHSRWAPRTVWNLGLRYYLTLDNGAAPGAYTVKLDESSQGRATISGLKHHSGNVYYVEVTFPDTRVLPGRVYQVGQRPNSAGLQDDLFRRSVDFTISADRPENWNPANDWSYDGMSGDSVTVRPRIPIYDYGQQVGGSQP